MGLSPPRREIDGDHGLERAPLSDGNEARGAQGSAQASGAEAKGGRRPVRTLRRTVGVPVFPSGQTGGRKCGERRTGPKQYGTPYTRDCSN